MKDSNPFPPIQGRVAAKRSGGAKGVQRARFLRKNLTEEKTILWVELRTLRKKGFHFRRQVPRDGYVLDFACIKAKVIIEVDGIHHATGSQKKHDVKRDAHFAGLGYLILRYWNDEIRSELDAVVNDIIQRTGVRLSPPDPAAPAHPPRKRGGKGQA